MSRSIYRFGDCRIDPSARELRRAGELLTLSPKVFDCIAYLVEKRDRAVGRDELTAAVWGQADVTDVQLRDLMRKVRRAIGDSGDGQSTIRTIPRFGYRWVAEAQIAETPAQEEQNHASAMSLARTSPPPSSGDAPTRVFGGRRRIRIPVRVASLTFVAIVLALGFAAGIRLWSSSRGANTVVSDIGSTNAGAGQQNNAIAVLPVTGDVVDSESAWMRLGLMDLIASRLRESDLVVVPSSEIVALTRDQSAGLALTDTVRAATGAHDIIVPSAQHTVDGWTMRLEVNSGLGAPRKVEAHSVDAILAGREVADQLLGLFDKRPPTDSTDSTDSAPSAAGELTQRIEAALLVDDFTSARHLLESAPPKMLETPELQLDAARIDIRVGKIDQARERLEKTLIRISAEAAPVLRARVLNHLGAVAFHLDQRDLAEQRFTESIALLEHHNEPTLLGQAYARRGGINALQGRYDLAESDFARARTAFDIDGNTLDLAVVELNEGGLEGIRNHQAQALALFERAVQHSERFGSRINLVHALGNEINAYLDLLQPAKALAASDRIRLELAHMDESPDTRFVRTQEVQALLATGQTKAARDVLESLVHAVDPIRESELLAIVRGLQAELDLDSGQWQSAADHAGYAVGVLSAPENVAPRSRVWLVKIRAMRALHERFEVNAETNRFSEWAHDKDNPSVKLHAALAEAELAWAEGRRDDAYQFYADALHVAHQGGVPADIAEVVVAYGNALLSAGELARSSTVIGQTARWADTDFQCAMLQARLSHALGKDGAWRVAYDQARVLAGERPIPPEIAVPPSGSVVIAERH
jgi:DNA-binding winged helix-turn-helix (wHTH) protein/tetratricopeptide (TPR) repeat protein